MSAEAQLPYAQWEWQQNDLIWRRYPCTVSHKLNCITDGETIYVEISSWIYLITKTNSVHGTQTNLFTQTTRKIRLITNPCIEDRHASPENDAVEHKSSDPATDEAVSLYYNYSFANVILLSSLQHAISKIQTHFFNSLPCSEYEIVSINHIQLPQNNHRYTKYKQLLSELCEKYAKRKDELEILLWSHCSHKSQQTLYAHPDNAIDIIQHEHTVDHEHLPHCIYFCRAISLKHCNEDNHDMKSDNEPLDNAIDAKHIIATIPLYLVSFKPISFTAEHESAEEEVVSATSLFAATDTNQSSLLSFATSYSQPLLSLKGKRPAKSTQNTSNYGTMSNRSNSYQPSWHELVQQEDNAYYSSTFDINNIIDSLLLARTCKPGTFVNLRRADIDNICIYSKTVLMQQPVFLELESPINVVGDIHGQFYDLLRLFEHGSYPPQSNYVFLGDYVDRGGQSIECICLLLCYKIKYEENFFLLRGNHESENINRIYGFYDECKRRYSVRLWRKFIDVFNHLPIAALICDKIFCVHGGLSPNLFYTKQAINGYNQYVQSDEVLNAMHSLEPDQVLTFNDNIRKIQRPTQIGECGLICDLLWSDPSWETDEFYVNGDRGVSYYFGKQVVDAFNRHYDIDLICRAHQVVEDGYEFFNKRKLVTVFSAPNYCGEFDNCASFMSVDDNLLCKFTTLDPQRRYQQAPIKKQW